MRWGGDWSRRGSGNRSDCLYRSFGLGASTDFDGAALRADEVRASIDRRAVMAAAPESDGRFFKVPKVIER